MVSGGGRSRPQEDALNNAIDMVVGTPGRVLQHIEDGNLVYGDIKYLVRIFKGLLDLVPEKNCNRVIVPQQYITLVPTVI